MNTSTAKDINHLVGDFMGYYEQWEDAPAAFPWDDLQALARDGAQAYNEGFGPSFHMLAFDGYPHGEFHERFLNYLLEAGFDPFKTVQAASGASYIPVFGHDGLTEAAKENPVSARMHDTLQAIARQRFGGDVSAIDAEELQRIVLLCHESIPDDVLSKIAPGFVSSALL
jgi:hypothetical protein